MYVFPNPLDKSCPNAWLNAGHRCQQSRVYCRHESIWRHFASHRQRPILSASVVCCECARLDGEHFPFLLVLFSHINALIFRSACTVIWRQMGNLSEECARSRARLPFSPGCERAYLAHCACARKRRAHCACSRDLMYNVSHENTRISARMCFVHKYCCSPG